MRDGGFGMYLPDIFPVPSTPKLREIGMHIQAQRVPVHLAGWAKVVRRESGSKAGVERYGRMLAVHHYWSTLKARHPGVFKRGNIQQRLK